MLVSRRLGKEPQLQKASENAPPLAQGSNGKGVAAMQEALADLGHDFVISEKPTGFDGIFGSETAKVVRKFQADNGLKADGLAGKMTLGRLDALMISTGLDERTPGEVRVSDRLDSLKPLPFRRNANY